MTQRSRFYAGKAALVAYVVAVLLFLLMPVFLVAPMSFSETTYLKFPPSGFTLRWYGEFFESEAWISATTRSLIVAFASAALATILGALAAIALRRNLRVDQFLRGAFLGPQVVPVIILALGILLLYSKLHLYGSVLGIIFAHSVLALPFVVTNVSGALRQRGETLTQAARVLGARPWQAFWFVTLPSLWPALTSSAIFAFFVSFDELVVALFIMGRNETLPMRIWSNVRDDLTPVVAAVATLLIVLTILALAVSEFLARPREIGKEVQ
ncbi:ABC transporter permease (plasmid) [Cupriavidus sp. P-10]|uniref:ABC transporter permease n=1 Tax=unclassified Cupriavidus TaxID=2640874 RepID=UPI000E2E94C3|nr:MULTISPECIES: ABC transporter permease [unclassified Cupriavidus]BDB30675.1 ABC transporter permease [Cupriavidus sp. P-10]